VLLPEGGRGFNLQGADFDRTILGTRFSRHATLSEGRAVLRSEVRTMEPEISVEALKANAPQLREVQTDHVWLQATPAALRFSDRAKPATSAPANAAGPAPSGTAPATTTGPATSGTPVTAIPAPAPAPTAAPANAASPTPSSAAAASTASPAATAPPPTAASNAPPRD
jgi:hypothetical protein